MNLTVDLFGIRKRRRKPRPKAWIVSFAPGVTGEFRTKRKATEAMRREGGTSVRPKY